MYVGKRSALDAAKIYSGVNGKALSNSRLLLHSRTRQALCASNTQSTFTHEETADTRKETWAFESYIDILFFYLIPLFKPSLLPASIIPIYQPLFPAQPSQP